MNDNKEMKEVTDFAMRVDELMYGFDTYDYRDNIEGREDGLTETVREILSDNTDGIKETLEEIAEYSEDPEEVKEAKELLRRLPEIAGLANNLNRRVSNASI
jgi:hypothetical protein